MCLCFELYSRIPHPILVLSIPFFLFKIFFQRFLWSGLGNMKVSWEVRVEWSEWVWFVHNYTTDEARGCRYVWGLWGIYRSFFIPVFHFSLFCLSWRFYPISFTVAQRLFHMFLSLSLSLSPT